MPVCHTRQQMGLKASSLLIELRIRACNNREGGFSIVYVLTAVLILIAGTATLLNQATSTSLGSSFQGQSSQARNVASSGMNYLISQLNKQANRNLLVVPESQITSNPQATTTLWTDSQAATHHINPCTAIYTGGRKTYQAMPSLSDLNLGEDQANNGYFYISNNGDIGKIRNGSMRAFRIISRAGSEDFKLPVRSGNSRSLLEDTKSEATFRLSVEAVIFRDGQSNKVVSRAVLQEDFSVVPKCCRVSYGGHLDASNGSLKGHGNSNYALNRYDLVSNSCMLPGLDPDGFGIVVGSFIQADGATIKNSQGIAVNPLFCVSTNKELCTTANNTSGNQVEHLDITLPNIPRYPGYWKDQDPAPSLKACASLSECPSGKLLQYDSASKRTIFNAAAVTSTAMLPSNCTLYRNDVHCIYSQIDLSTSSNDLIFVSGNNTRRIRLYFPTAGNVITQIIDRGTLRHCKVSSCSGPGAFVDNTTDVSMFGSACPYDATNPKACGAQVITIKGSVREARFFIYAPEAIIKIIGLDKATYQGVIWAKGLDIRGTSAIPTIPKTGVADVFLLMGILPDESNTLSKSITGESSFTNLFPFDVVARSTSRRRFLGD